MIIRSLIKEAYYSYKGVKLYLKKNDIKQLIIRGNISADNVHIGKALVTKGKVIFNVTSGTLTIGERVFFNDDCKVNVHDKVIIEDGVLFGQNVMIYDHDHDYLSDNVRANYKTAPVFIGENTWIGSNVIILRGTHIGKNCVIGAGCVVKGNVPDNSLYIEKREREIRIINKESLSKEGSGRS